MNLFHPDIQVAFARSYTASFQRALSRDMAVDIRYVGTRGVNQWTDENYNEINIIENGFYDEFVTAMGNLQANQARGTREHVRVHGRDRARRRCRPTSRISTARSDVNNPAAYSGNNWTNSTFVGRLARDTAAAVRRRRRSRRQRHAARPTRRAPGVPANHFVLNPDVSTSGGRLQHLDERRLQQLRRAADRAAAAPLARIPDQRQLPVRAGVRIGQPRQALRPRLGSDRATSVTRSRSSGTGSIPVGRGRHFGTDMHPALDALVGGWGFNGAGRIQARTWTSATSGWSA